MAGGTVWADQCLQLLGGAMGEEGGSTEARAGRGAREGSGIREEGHRSTRGQRGARRVDGRPRAGPPHRAPERLLTAKGLVTW